jgi:hypothetical protein
MYCKNSTRGQWKAHGRYLARENARRDPAHEAGFDGDAQEIDVASRLQQWQSAGDERLWRIIVSPEFGDRLNLPRLTRELMERMEQDLGTSLEWVAVCHFNTDNPHAHVALRGVRDNGQPLSLGRDYVKRGIRSAAEEQCSCQLGYRSRSDVLEAQSREVAQHRFTSLDRIIARGHGAELGVDDFRVDAGLAQFRNKHLIARLKTLETMGLAEADGHSQWRVRSDFEMALRAMQRTGDRQKMLEAHGVLVSDARLPLQMLDSRRIRSLAGRILMHGEDEGTGRNFMMLEGTDATVHCVYYTPEMSEARSRGWLRANSFVRIQRVFVDGRSQIELDDLGDANQLLSDRRHFQETARKRSGAGSSRSTITGAGGLDVTRKLFAAPPLRLNRTWAVAVSLARRASVRTTHEAVEWIQGFRTSVLTDLRRCSWPASRTGLPEHLFCLRHALRCRLSLRRCR